MMKSLKNLNIETSLVVQWLGLYLPMQGMRVQSLAYASWPKKPKHKQKQFCNKFIKT